MKWFLVLALLLIVGCLCSLWVQWEQLRTMEQLVTLKRLSMTDPGPLELVASWRNSKCPNGICEVRLVRQQGQTVTDWENDFFAEQRRKLLQYPPGE